MLYRQAGISVYVGINQYYNVWLESNIAEVLHLFEI
jgi:hypothetical protein